jgi:hypothetical protein
MWQYTKAIINTNTISRRTLANRSKQQTKDKLTQQII